MSDRPVGWTRSRVWLGCPYPAGRTRRWRCDACFAAGKCLDPRANPPHSERGQDSAIAPTNAVPITVAACRARRATRR